MGTETSSRPRAPMPRRPDAARRRETAPDRAAALLVRAEAAYRDAVGDPAAAGRALPALVAEARRAGAAEALVVALRAQAWCDRNRLAAAEAKAGLDEAVRVARRAGLTDRLAAVLATRGAVQHELGRLGAARSDLAAARALLAGRPSRELDLQEAVLAHNTGRLADAAALYRRLLADPATPDDVAAKVGNNLALIEADAGQHRAALAHLDTAAGRAAAAGPALVAIVEHSRGIVTVQGGRLAEGMRRLDRAAALHEAAGLDLGEHYVELADVLADLWLLPEAGRTAGRAAAAFEAAGVRLLAAEARLREARVALRAGRPEDAVPAAQRAADGFRRQRRASWAAQARLAEVEALDALGTATERDLDAVRRAAGLLARAGLVSAAVDARLVAGRLAARLGHRRAAEGEFTGAAALGRSGPVLVRLRGRLAAAEDARLRGDRAAVLVQCRAGLADLARHRAALPSLELRALASGHGRELGRLGLGAVLATGSATRVLDWLERTRAAALLATEEPRGGGEPADGGGPPDLAALRAVHAELAAAGDDAGPELRERAAAVEAAVRRASWSAEARAPGPDRGRGGRLDVPSLRRALGGRVLVEYGEHDGRLLAVVLGPRRARLVPLGPADEVDAEGARLLFALRSLGRVGVTAPAAARGLRATAEAARDRLADRLLRPLGLPADAPLVVVPTARAQRLPWAALHAGPVALAPSAVSWARTARRPPPPDGTVLLAAGPGLPGAAAEVEALRGVHSGATVLPPAAATVDAVTAGLGGARLAHLACHGRLRADNPAFSSLLLAGGELTVHELDVRALAPHVAVLSACDSAADSVYAGDELLGFVSALVAAGTAGLVASVVLVPDAAVVPLMTGLHRGLATGLPVADALHAARAGLDLDDPATFAASCAFSAYGAA